MQYTCIILLSAALMVQVYGQQQRKNVPSFSRVQAKINIRPAPASSSTPAAVTKGAGKMPLQYENSWKALDTLRGHQSLQNDELRMIMLSAQPGVDYPALSYIPENPGFTCQSVNQPGFYADPTTMCQVFRRCDLDGNLFSFLCPNTTIFNQITLTCDYFYNVDCAQSVRYYDYSNARLYHEGWPLLGN